jgi:hypothetical protein
VLSERETRALVDALEAAYGEAMIRRHCWKEGDRIVEAIDWSDARVTDMEREGLDPNALPTVFDDDLVSRRPGLRRLRDVARLHTER